MNSHSPIPTKPSRRAVLAVLSVGAASAVAPAALAVPSAPVTEIPLRGLAASVPGLPCADAELFKLLEDHRSAAAEQRRLYKATEILEKEWFRRQAPLEKQIPVPLHVRPEDLELEFPGRAARAGYYKDRDGVGLLRYEKWLRSKMIEDGDESYFYTWKVTPSPVARARADEIIGAFDKWKKQCERRPRGLRSAQRAKNAAEDRLWALERKIHGTRAHSIAGLIAKAQMDCGVEMADSLGAALIADLVALGERGRS
jgi:hypothetical protein